jgi:ribonuclease HI
MTTTTIYTDGACRRNPGPGGFAAVIVRPGGREELGGFEAATTNNRLIVNGGKYQDVPQLHFHLISEK